MSKILHVNVANKVATYQKRDGAIVCGNRDYQLKFTFDAEWAEHSKKTARFLWGGDYFDVEFTGDTCDVPMISGTKTVEVGVYAGDLETTTGAEIPCLLSILCKGGAPHPETGQHYTSEAVAAANAAKASETNAKTSETNAKASETNAKTSETNARASETNAASSATSAKADAEIARQFAGNTEDIEARIARNSKRITNLERGLVPDPFETDGSAAYAKIVPIGALPFAEVAKVGGMSHRDTATNTLKDVKVTEVKSIGANLIPYPYRFGGSITQNGITVTANSDGSLTINGTSTGYCWIVCGSIETIVGAKYSMRAANCPNIIGMYAYYDNNDTNLFRDIPTVLTAKQSYYTLVLSVDAGNTFTKQTIYPMINTGTTALPFAPYKCDTRAIPSEVQALEGYGLGVDATYCNHISWENGDGVQTYHKMVTKRIFTGTEGGWVVVETKGGGKRFQFYNATDKPLVVDVAKTSPLVCSHLPAKSANETWDNQDGASMQGEMFYIKDARYTTVEEWRAHLAAQHSAGNPFTIVYAVAAPTVTDISDLITDDNMIEVEGGGVIVAVNANKQSAPTAITYQLKEESE